MSILKIKDKDGKWVDIPALKGKDGAAGKDGYTPVKGTDYWTAQDKEELKTELKNDYTILDANNYRGPKILINNQPSGGGVDNRFKLRIIRWGCFVAIQGYLYASDYLLQNERILTGLPFGAISAFDHYTLNGGATGRKITIRVLQDGNIIAYGAESGHIIDKGEMIQLNLVYACKDI
jgi:hypothetical protein